MQGSITFDELKAMENDFLTDRSNRIAMNAVVNNGLLISAKNAEVYRTTTHNFSVNIKQGEITNQKASPLRVLFKLGNARHNDRQPPRAQVNIKQGEITNQKASGRCWMFAALNTMRFQVMQKLNLDTFELSQNYTLFYDKLEKANYFYESILQTLDEPVSGRLIAHLLSAPLNDGGQWDMFTSLIEKYGIVPKSAMPETIISM